MKRLVMAVAAALAGMALLAGCGSSGGATGTLKVAITDKMSDVCSNVVITVKEIRAVPAGQDPNESTGLPLIVRFDTPKQIDVLQWKFVAQELGQAVIPAGSYSQLRLILDENKNPNNPVNYLIRKDDPLKTHIAIKTPSGHQSGLKVLGRFTVEENRITAMMIDFDPNTAIVYTGNSNNHDYNFKPTGIRLVKMDKLLIENDGTIPGYGFMAGTIRTTAPMSSTEGAYIAVKPYGTTTTIASGAVFGSYSAPFTAFVPAGDYRVHVTSPGFLPYSSPKTTVVAGKVYTTLADILLKLTP